MATTEINVEITCPHCENSDWRDIDALVDSGRVPQNVITCGLCDGKFTVEACIDLAIIPTKEPTP